MEIETPTSRDRKILNSALNFGIVIVTQVIGLLLNLSISFTLTDFIWRFRRMAMINSFILGVSLLNYSYISQNLIFRTWTFYVLFISFSVIIGTSILCFLMLLFTSPPNG